MNEQVTVPVQPAKEKRVFSRKEMILAWLSVVVGYLYCRSYAVWEKPFYGFLFTIVLFLFGGIFLKGAGAGNKRALFYPVSALVVNAALFTGGSPFLSFWVFVYSVIAFFMWCQTRKEGALEKWAGALYFYELLCGLILAPILSFVRGFQAISSNKGGKKAGKTVLFILIGLCIAIIPTMIVYLLLSFDTNFTGMIDDIFDCISEEVMERILSAVLGIPVGMLFYGALFASAEGTARGIQKEQGERMNNTLKFLPQVISIMALLPIFLLYIVFIIAQKDYYAAVFSGTLPAAETFSSFARDGFFRLCFVAALNAGAVALLRILTKKSGSGKIAPSVRVGTVLFSLVTIVMAATAVSQMLMYVSAYGLTELRVYSLWFMALITAAFLVALLAQFFKKLPFAAVTAAVFLLFFSVLVIPDSNALISKYNYQCYLNGAKVDLEYFAELGDSGVPELVKLTEAKDEAVATEAKGVLIGYLSNGRAHGIESLSLSRILADKALAEVSRDTLIEGLNSGLYGTFYPKADDQIERMHFIGFGEVMVMPKYGDYCDGRYFVEEGKITVCYTVKGRAYEQSHSIELDEHYAVLIDGKKLG